MPILFANTDVIVGNTGWAGAGLLGLLLAWLLFKHLPDLDASRKAERTDFLAALKYQQDKFDVSIERVVAHCREELEAIASKIEKAK